MRANVKLFSDANFLIEVKQRARGRDVIRFRRFAPGRAVVRPARDNDRKPQRHAQCKASLFVLIRRAHNSRHDFQLPVGLTYRLSSICLLRLFLIVPTVKTLARFFAKLALVHHAAKNFRRPKSF